MNIEVRNGPCAKNLNEYVNFMSVINYTHNKIL